MVKKDGNLLNILGLGKNEKGPSMIGVTYLNLKDSQIHFFLHFSHDIFYISPFILMSNEIILFQILYRPLKFIYFSFMKVRIIKFIQCGSCYINGSKFQKN